VQVVLYKMHKTKTKCLTFSGIHCVRSGLKTVWDLYMSLYTFHLGNVLRQVDHDQVDHLSSIKTNTLVKETNRQQSNEDTAHSISRAS
jgi:hypothetical protein